MQQRRYFKDLDKYVLFEFSNGELDGSKKIKPFSFCCSLVKLLFLLCKVLTEFKTLSVNSKYYLQY